MTKRKQPKNNRIHLLYDKLHFGEMPWIVKFVAVYDADRNSVEPITITDSKGDVAFKVWAKWRTRALALTDAIEQSKKFAPTSLRIHGRDGRIVRNGERSYGRGSESSKKG